MRCTTRRGSAVAGALCGRPARRCRAALKWPLQVTAAIRAQPQICPLAPARAQQVEGFIQCGSSSESEAAIRQNRSGFSEGRSAADLPASPYMGRVHHRLGRGKTLDLKRPALAQRWGRTRQRSRRREPGSAGSTGKSQRRLGIAPIEGAALPRPVEDADGASPNRERGTQC